VVHAASGESRSQVVVLGIVERDELGRLGEVAGVEELLPQPVGDSLVERRPRPLRELVANRLVAFAELPGGLDEKRE
jgi:hypothetical protein